MKKVLIAGIILGALSIAVFYSLNPQGSKTNPSDTLPQRSPANNATDIQSSFAIFTNGTLRIFSDPRYHNLSTDAYIQGDNPNIIHIKKRGVTWGDFFKTLPMKLSYDCLTTGTGQTFCSDINQQLKFYINKNLIPDALDTVINDGDQLLVSFGDENEEQINNQMQQVSSVK